MYSLSKFSKRVGLHTPPVFTLGFTTMRCLLRGKEFVMTVFDTQLHESHEFQRYKTISTDNINININKKTANRVSLF